jgi:hypothetical protein
MTAPQQSSCLKGGGPSPGGVGQPETFRGLQALCGACVTSHVISCSAVQCSAVQCSASIV